MMSVLMAFYPDVQEKLCKELQEVFATQDEEVTEEKLNQLPYMDMVIKEVMRFVKIEKRIPTQTYLLSNY